MRKRASCIIPPESAHHRIIQTINGGGGIEIALVAERGTAENGEIMRSARR